MTVAITIDLPEEQYIDISRKAQQAGVTVSDMISKRLAEVASVGPTAPELMDADIAHSAETYPTDEEIQAMTPAEALAELTSRSDGPTELPFSKGKSDKELLAEYFDTEYR